MKTKVSANMFRGKDADGGHLIFKEDGLLFESHFSKTKTNETKIPYSEIKAVKLGRTLGIIPNGIKVQMNDDTEYRFAIWNRKEIIEFIQSKIKQ
jgi:hypothetical protein